MPEQSPNGGRSADPHAWWALLPASIVVLIAAATWAEFPFDGLYGQDAFAYFRFARAIWPHVLRGVPLPNLFWPRGYPVAVAALLPLTAGNPVAGQIVSVLSCAWTAVAAFLIARTMDEDTTDQAAPIAPLAGALTVAASGAVLRYSQVVMADALGMALAATAMYAATRFAQTGRSSWSIVGAVALGWGAITRWMVGLLALPIGGYFLLAWRARDPGGAIDRRRPLLAHLLVAVTLTLAIVVTQLIELRNVPYAFFRHEWLEHWNAGNVMRSDFHTPEGHTHYRLPVGLFYVVRFAWPDYLFPTAAAFAVVGTATLIERRALATLALLVGWPLVAWLFLSGIPYENPRFLLPTLPAVGVLVAFGFGRLQKAIVARFRPRRRWLPAAVLVASLGLGIAFGAREHAQHVVARKNADLALVRWADQRIPTGGTLLMKGGSLIFEYYGATAVQDTYMFSPGEFADVVRRCSGRCYYLANVDDIGAGGGPVFDQQLQALRGRLISIDARPPHFLCAISGL
jgi:hypothetical protein